MKKLLTESMPKTRLIAAAAIAILAAGAWTTIRAQGSGEPKLDVYAGVDHSAFALGTYSAGKASRLTEEIAAQLVPSVRISPATLAAAALAMKGPQRSGNFAFATATKTISSPGTIDKRIFQRMAQAGVRPAERSTDFEFLRRVTLDLTGRIPSADQVLAFVTDTRPNKRELLIDQLLASPEWVDKWTMWFGDHFNNSSRNVLNANRFIDGVVAFNDYIRSSLMANKPYNQMAYELISAEGANSYQQGDLNFLVGGVMGGGPIQDVFDKQVATTAETFLGIAHLDCLLCHSGRGHLDALNLWGYFTSRQAAWGMASFMSHTATRRIPVNAGMVQPYYWTLRDDIVIPGRRGGNFTVDYRLNTLTGNRPPRGALDSTETVPPLYIFDGEGPMPGERYRAALARKITTDFQFARATVNFLWEYFFGIGLVTPSNQFDPMRLDPRNPPQDCPIPSNPCELQASHPFLLNELAQDFIDSGYDLKALMRQITTSRAYQLSARYDGTWDPANERLFARKLVRRLWAEEVHDAVVKSSGVPAVYRNRAWGPVNWAMQLPEPVRTPNFLVSQFLDAFLRGNRDDDKRRGDASITQALAMMNDSFVISRVISNASGTLINKVVPLPDDQAVTNIYLTVLNRLPTDEESKTALANLQAGQRTAELRILLWSLYNRADFLYNY